MENPTTANCELLKQFAWEKTCGFLFPLTEIRELRKQFAWENPCGILFRLTQLRTAKAVRLGECCEQLKLFAWENALRRILFPLSQRPVRLPNAALCSPRILFRVPGIMV